jgi:hypothetical protein
MEKAFRVFTWDRPALPGVDDAGIWLALARIIHQGRGFRLAAVA